MARRYIVANEKAINDGERDPYILLAAAIVRQVIYDLEHAIEYGNRGEEYACVKWLLSEYGQMLSGNNGQYIIDEVYKSCRKENTKWQR